MPFQIAKESSYEFVEKGSKFIGYVVSISSEQEANDHLKQKREEHPKANHVCYAYRLINGIHIVENLSDDGEPTNSAGQPILKQIQSKELVNTLVMVVRYFGGVKLGVGGLIKSYRTGAAEAIKNSSINEIVPMTQIDFSVSYEKYGEVVSILSRNQIAFNTSEDANGLRFRIDIESSKRDEVQGILEPLGISF